MTVIADTIPLAEAQSLVDRARAGDYGALEHVFRAYERSVYTLARRLTRTPEDAEAEPRLLRPNSQADR